METSCFDGSSLNRAHVPCVILLVGAVQLQLLPDRGAAGDLHLHLHQDAVPGHPQRPHGIPWFLLESCENRREIEPLGITRVLRYGHINYLLLRL
ncbi:hypothetical protein EJB05_34674 [Eragrostis curvula]|uniref:Uncharacterized protein n=1 Tax=Eragrostis curvula TaxID=38414 RepID=A0A5J9U5L4_9POAL|nr:hypothetical protein EJB05_34674 [Eragrostis curvula]